MPQVDFTLQDVKNFILDDFKPTVIAELKDYVQGEFRDGLMKDVRHIVKTEIDDRFTAFEDKYEDDMCSVKGSLDDLDISLGNVESRLTTVEHEFHEVKQDVRSIRPLVKQHSQDIMDLRARQA